MSHHLTLARMTIIKKICKQEILERVWRKRTPLHSWWERKLVQPLWRTVQKFLKRPNRRATVWSNNPTPGHTVREKYGSNRYMHPNVHGFPDSSVGKYSTWGDPGSILGLGRSAGEGRGYPLLYSWASLVAQLVKNPPAMQETWVRSLGWKDPLEKGKSIHSTILAWRIPWTV